MKSFLSLILAFVFVIGVCFSAPFALKANAASVDDLIFVLNEDGYSYTVAASNNPQGDLVIPERYNNIPVVAIGAGALSYSKNLRSVKIPGTIARIEDSAFRACSNLESVTISNGVEYVGDFAFMGCESLKRVELPDSVVRLGKSAFYECVTLESAHIGNGLTKIPESAFEGCTYLSAILIGENIEKIEKKAFFNCTFLKAIEIPESVDYIGAQAFQYCTLMEFMFFPASVSTIAYSAFSDCYSLKAIILNEGIKTIENSAFYNCYALGYVTIPMSVRAIGEQAFGYCENSDTSKIEVLDGFIIEGTSGLEAEEYARNNGITFVSNGAHAHIGESKITKEPTCTEEGLRSFVCWCGYAYSESVPKKSHSYDWRITEHPTKEHNGKRVNECTYCGDINTEEELLYVNEYITSNEKSGVFINESTNEMSVDIYGAQDLGEFIYEMNGLTIKTISNLDYGYYGTGSTVQVIDTTGTQVAEYTLVVRGDVNGDSVCDVLDVMLIELARTQNRTLDEGYLSAGDLAENGVIDGEDFNAIVNKAIA